MAKRIAASNTPVQETGESNETSMELTEAEAAAKLEQEQLAAEAEAARLAEEEAAKAKAEEEALAAAAAKEEADKVAAEQEAAKIKAEEEAAVEAAKVKEAEEAAAKLAADEEAAAAAAKANAPAVSYHVGLVNSFANKYANEMNLARSYVETTAVANGLAFVQLLRVLLNVKDQSKFNEAWSALIGHVKSGRSTVFSENAVFRGWTAPGFTVSTGQRNVFNGLVMLLLTSAKVGAKDVKKFQDIRGFVERAIVDEHAKQNLLAFYSVE